MGKFAWSRPYVSLEMDKRGKKETHAVKHKGTGDYHVDNQEWSQVDKDPSMAIAYTEKGAKKRAGQLNKYHNDTEWEAVPASPYRH